MIKNLVSVIIPTYNDESYLRDCLDDMVNQTYNNIEVIIVNDGSVDNTESILKEYCSRYDNFKYFNKDNGGTGSALNYGFSKASGEFGTWISSDDRKNHNMIERLVGFLKENRDIEYVTSAFESEYLGSILRSYIPADNTFGFKRHIFGAPHNNILSKESFSVDDWVDINREQCYQGVNYMFTMRLKNECKDFLTIPGEDYHMAVKMGMKSRVGYIDECLGIHNNPPDSLSSQNRNCVAEANLVTWNLIDEKYKKWHLKKVPKLAHFYWGNEKMSFLRYMTLKSFHLKNPDWSLILYVPKNIESNKFWKDTNHRCDLIDYSSSEDYWEKINLLPIQIVEVDFDKFFNGKAISEVHKSDFLRWYLLYNYGGFWSDMDILYLKSLKNMSINETKNDNLECLINYGKTYGARIGALFSSKNKNPFFKELMNSSKLELMKDSTEITYQEIGASLVNNTLSRFFHVGDHPLVTYKFMEKDRKVNFDSFPDKDFYFIDHKQLENVFVYDEYDNIYKNSIGIHWYGGHPLSQEYNNKVNEKNYMDYNCTISKAIQVILGGNE